jgi:hypothetical protein
MVKWQRLLILGVLGLLSLQLVRSAAIASSNYSLEWSVCSGGSSAGAQLSSTVGQTAIGPSTGAQRIGSGFWYGASLADYGVYLPLVVKSG